MNIAQTIIRPVMTEKSVNQEAQNKFSFIVHDTATKVDVKNALTLRGASGKSEHVAWLAKISSRKRKETHGKTGCQPSSDHHAQNWPEIRSLKIC